MYILYICISIFICTSAREHAQHTTHCSYSALLDSSVLYILHSTLLYRVCYGFNATSHDPHWANEYWRQMCYTHFICSALCLTCGIQSMLECWITYVYITILCLCTLVYGVLCVQSYTHTDDVVAVVVATAAAAAAVIRLFHIAKRNQDLHEHKHLCDGIRESSFYHTKRFSIHVMRRVLISFLLQLLLLLLLFART